MLDIHIPNRLKWLLRRSRGILFVMPYLVVKGVLNAIEFYKCVFEAVKEYRLNSSDGKHCKCRNQN